MSALCFSSPDMPPFHFMKCSLTVVGNVVRVHNEVIAQLDSTGEHMADRPKLIAILASSPDDLAAWGGWLAADGFEIHPSYNVTPSTLPENTALVLFCHRRLEKDPTLVAQLRERLPLAALLCATSAEKAADVLAYGVDDIVTDPLCASVLQNRVRQMLPRAVSFTETIQRTAAALVGPHTQGDLLELVLRQIKLVMPKCDAANIVLLGPDGDEMLIAHHATHFDPNDASDRAVLRRFEYSLSMMPNFQRMAETRQPLLVADRTQQTEWVPMKDTDWVRCYLGAPIVVQDTVIGFINLDSATPRAFNIRQAQQLQSFAYHVGVAIYHSRLIEQLTAVREHLEDVVEQRTQELAQEQAQLKLILDSIDDGILYYDKTFRPVYVNRALLDLFGYSEAEWLSGDVYVQTRDMNDADRLRYRQQVVQSVERLGIWQVSGPVSHKDGTQFDAQMTVRPRADEDGGFVVVYRDISQETALMERQQRFVAYASHELRTPITNIRTQLYLVRRRPERADYHLGVMEEVAARMTNLVEDLLTLSRMGNHRMTTDRQEIDLRDVVLAVHRVQGAEAARANMRLALVLPGDPVIFAGDHGRLVQVITNLTFNALIHTVTGNQITLRLECGSAPEAGCVHSNPAIFEQAVVDTVPNWAVIHVEDQGSGIDANHLPHLFQPFYRASEQKNGTGLGLAIAAEITRLHGGTLTVESQPGEGSTFSLWVPLAPAEERAST